jgi:hypothetical protein
VVVKLAGVHAARRLQQVGLHLGGVERGLQGLVGGLADDADVLAAELTAPEGGSGAGEVLQPAGVADLAVGSAVGDVEDVLEPLDAGDVGIGWSLGTHVRIVPLTTPGSTPSPC